MKKSLIALAALATVATAAQAQSSVTVYGLLDAGVYHKSSHDTNGNGVTGVASGVLATPRFGFRGSEDLGGGNKAVFQLESGIANGTGVAGNTSTAGAQASLFDRYAYVGLANSLGQLDFGRNTNAGWNYAAAGITDPLALQLEGITLKSSGVVNSTTVPNWRVNQVISIVGNTELGTTRSDNSIKFTSAKFNGFDVRATYGIGGTAGEGEKNRSYSLGASYTNGDFAAAASTFEANDVNKNSLKYNSFGATYKFAGVKLTGGYHELKADKNYTRTAASATAGSAGNLAVATPSNAPIVTSSVDGKSEVWTVGAGYDVTSRLNSTIAYYNGKFSSSTSSATGNGGKLNSYALVNKYALSKRTTAYLVLDYSKANEAIRLSSSADKNIGYAVGVNHTF